MPKWIAGLAVVVVTALAVGLWAFEPWTKFTSSTVDEALPTVAADVQPGEGVSSEDVAPEVLNDANIPQDVPAAQTPKAKTPKEPKTKAPAPAPEPEPEALELASGQFENAEYETNGVAKVIKLADGSRFVRLEGFSTSNGPDLYVGLSNSPSGGAWGSYDDIRYVQLDNLKATNGNQNYAIPADVDLKGFQSVVIWCDRFNVAVGTAPVSL